jgi:hypothetical protein
VAEAERAAVRAAERAAAALAEAKAVEEEAQRRRAEEEEQAARRAEAEALEQLRAKRALRAENMAPKRLDEATLKGLDSSMKKVTPFLKKVRERLGEDTRAQVRPISHTVIRHCWLRWHPFVLCSLCLFFSAPLA